MEDNEIQYDDTFIIKEVIQIAVDIENKMNTARMSGEIWTLMSSSKYKALGPIKGKYTEKLRGG